MNTPNPEPDDEVVAAFVAAHPSGGTLEEVSAAIGVTRQRTEQIVKRALRKIYRQLSQRNCWRLDDLI